jgi:hypothetical protein
VRTGDAMRMYRGVDVKRHAFSSSALGGHEVSDSCSFRITPREGSLYTHCIGYLLLVRAVLGVMKICNFPIGNRTWTR